MNDYDYNLSKYIKQYNTYKSSIETIDQINKENVKCIYKYFLLKQFNLVNDINKYIILFSDFLKHYRLYYNTCWMKKKLNDYKLFDLDNNQNTIKQLSSCLQIDMMKHFNHYFKKIHHQTSHQIINNLIKRLSNTTYCFQGGYGHAVHGDIFTHKHHWCIKPEYYEQIKPLDYEYLALKLNNRYIHVSDKPKQERWGN
ncbi:MAG TPA: hypothetical protein VLG50_06660 [Candidatus Saccharimonadales bacterium]|nr:hypothetical protein [Candidatus Saccharimonadales bacterium]